MEPKTPKNTSDFFCFPVCINCRESGKCEKYAPLPPRTGRKPHVWKPADEPDTMLKCGHSAWLWPLLRVLGEHIDKVWCDYDGWQPIAPERKQKGSGKGRKLRPEIPGQGEIVPY